MTTSSFRDGQGPSENSHDAAILIIGDNYLQDELLCGFLHEQTGLVCTNVGRQEDAAGVVERLDAGAVVVLVNCHGLTDEQLWSMLPGMRPCVLYLLLNVDPSRNLEHKALDRGVRGVLYKGDEVSLFPKAVRAVLGGELWYPRRVLEERLLNDVYRPSFPGGRQSALTLSERKVFALMAGGLSNKDIARKLCVSPHTVKTHVYNIFKKLKVRNRLEAMLLHLEDDN